MVYDEKSVIIWTTFLLKAQCCFSLVSFKVFKYFFLVFSSFIMMCLGMISLTLSWLPFTEFLRSVNWLFHQIWEILAIVSSNGLMYQYLFFWDSKDMNAKHYDIVPQISVAMLIIFQSLVPLSFRLDNSYSSVFKFTDSSLLSPCCHWVHLVNLLFQIIHFSVLKFPFKNRFYFSAENVYLFMYFKTILYLMDHHYENCFDTFAWSFQISVSSRNWHLLSFPLKFSSFVFAG